MPNSLTAGGPPIGRRDIVITLSFAVFGVAFTGWMQDGPHGGTAPARPVMGFVILLAIAPLLWRRRAPLLAAAGTLLGTTVHVAAYGTIGRCGLLLPLLFVEAFAVAAWLDRRGAVAGLGILLGSSVVCLAADSAAGLDGLIVAIPVIVVVWVIGRTAHVRAAMVARLRERNGELLAQRETNARLEVESDRVRLSAELDALLRRRLSDLTRFAEAAAHESSDDARAAGDAFAQIETESRATLEQMRSVVGLLRDGEAGTAPQPTLDHLNALLLSHKGSGSRLTVVGEPRVLPVGLELSAYRVVEHLLAATGEARDVHVHVEFGPDTLELTVTGPARTGRRRSDAALDRARERVALHQGRLETATDGGRTRATASLPVLVGT